MPSQTAFPLEVSSTGDLKALCQVLWNWELCESCLNAGTKGLQRCGVASCNCPWARRAERLEPFFEFYRKTTRPYVPDFFGDDDQAIRSHQDLLDIISLIKRYGTLQSREFCMAEYFASRSSSKAISVPRSDQDRAFQLAASIITMVDVRCEQGQDSYYAGANWDIEDNQRHGDLPGAWRENDTLQTLMDDSFPTHIHPSLQDADAHAPLIKANLTAINLKRIANLKIEGTDNLQDHLKLNQSTGVVEVFHHTGFLKEHLLATKEPTPTTTTNPGPSLLPRELALETLCTLQTIFPPDVASQALLRNLVSKGGFDPDCLRFGTAPFELCSSEKQRALRFPIWGTRLMDLYDEIENPKPRGRMDAWLERRSKSRHIMLATVVGVLTAVLLGLFGLCLSVFQTWIAWRQWKDGGR